MITFVNKKSLLIDFSILGLFLLLRRFDAVLQQLVVNVVGAAVIESGFDQLTAEPCPQKLLCSHAVVGDETQCRKGKCTKDADPRQGFRSQIGFENKVEAYCHGNRKNREDTLPHGQSKEHRLTVVPDFSVDFYFHTYHTLTGSTSTSTSTLLFILYILSISLKTLLNLSSFLYLIMH